MIRHGQSTWNAENRFTGWVDVDLTPAGEKEARDAGTLLADAAEDPEQPLDLRILHTSLLTRAIRTAELALGAAGRSWLPVRRDWRLNERHYGDLQGKNKPEIKEEFGPEKFMLWRRSYDTPPPELAPDNPFDVSADPRYEGMEDEVPRTECLADVVRRVEPYWQQMILPDLRAVSQWGGAVLSRPRQLHPRPAQAARGHLRRRHRRARGPDRHPVPDAPGRGRVDPFG